MVSSSNPWLLLFWWLIEKNSIVLKEEEYRNLEMGKVS